MVHEPSSGEKEPISHELTKLRVKVIEEYLDSKVGSAIATELRGGNTAIALHVVSMLNLSSIVEIK